MKKTLAWILALCMLMAAIPAMAEETASGRWYLVMLGLTSGTFDLNEDGTCVLTTSEDGEEMSAEGTWTQDGEKISVEINGDTLPLTLDGESLLFDEQGLAALGMDIPAAEDMDLSMLSSLIRISREPGHVTADEFNAYQEDGTVPEGKTEEDMQAAESEMMAFFMLLMGSTDTEFSGSDMNWDEPGPELSVLEDNFFVVESYGSREGMYIAKVQNNHDVPAYLSEGSITLLDADGNEVGATEFLGTTGSLYLDPGEETFVSLVAEVNEGAEVDHYTVNLQTVSVTYQTPDTAIGVDKVEIRVNEAYYTYYNGAVTITNTSEAPQANINAVMAVRDSDGKLVGLMTSSLYQNELAAGSTITLVDTVDSRVTDYLAQNGLSLGEAEALAWVAAY